MKRHLWRQIAALILLSSLAASAEPSQAQAWRVYSSRAELYGGGRDGKVSHSGSGGGRLSSKSHTTVSEHGLLVQRISAEDYLGKRLQLSGFLTTKSVTGWAGIWVRVDDQKGRVLSFENMMNRPVRGDTDWTRYTVTVDVPADAFEIQFGALLAGSGTIYVDDFDLQTTGGTRPAQALKLRIRTLPTEPENLGFEK